MNRRIAGIALQRLGLDVVAVADGEAAVRAACTEAFDLVLMDCRMPGLDGYEATRRIREVEAGGPTRVPILALTASVLQADREACIAAGMDSYLSKPITGERLRSALAPWLGGSGSSAGADGAAPPAPKVPDATVDPHTITALAEELGDDGIMAEVLAAYLRELPVRREAITAAAASGDSDTVCNIAHTLKSSSAALGALPLAEVCATLEAAARDGDDDAVAGTVGALVSQCTLVEREIKVWYRRLLGGAES